MKINDYLKDYQKVAYQVFLNAFEKNTLSHAYLLYGESVTPLKEIALFLGKSLLCDNPSPLACDECITCKRINEDKYRDFVIFDTTGKESIKKEDIEELEEEFSKTAFERKGKKVYIINLVENLNNTSVNSILKFLEEPTENVTAFLTTNNIQGVLPTIVSRCQTIKINPIPSALVISEAISLGVNEDDATLLSNIYNDAHIILKESKTKIYESLKENYGQFLSSLLLDDEEAFYKAEKVMMSYSKDKVNLKLLLDFLSKTFEDILIKQNENVLESEDIIYKLSKKLKNVDESLLEILKAKKKINSNVNITLVINHLIYTILKEELTNGR